MFSLIVTLLALLLVVALTLATLYYGADLSQQAGSKKQASRWLVESSQVLGALELYRTDKGAWPASLASLTPDYLHSELAEGPQGPWTMPVPAVPTLVQPTTSVAACRALNLLARGDDGIALKAYPSLKAQCFGDSSASLQVVVSASGDALLAGLGPNLRVNAPLPQASSSAEWFVVPGAPATAGTPQPRLSLSPSALLLSPVPVGTSADSPLVTVTNTGEVSAPALAFAALPATVSLLSNTCTSTLPAGGSCTFKLRFAPTAQGTLDTTLDLTAGTAAAQLELTAVSQGVAKGALSAVSTADFGALAIGGSAYRDFVFTNPGSAAATGVQASLTAVPSLSFASNTCGTAASPVTVEPGANCTMRVTWSPAAPDSLAGYPATVRVSGAFESAPASLSLSGTAGGFDATGQWSSTWGSTVAPTSALTDWGTYNLQSNNVSPRFYFFRNVGTVGNMSMRFKAVGDSSFYKLWLYKIANNGTAVSCGTLTYDAEHAEVLSPCTTDSTYRHFQLYVEYTPRTKGTHVVQLTPISSNGTVLPAPLELRAVAAFDPTGVWSSSYSSTIPPTEAFTSVRAGTCVDRVIYMRNVGTYGGLSASVRLEGDTDAIKFSYRTTLATQGGAYAGTCPSVLAPDALSVSECQAAVPTGTTGTPVHIAVNVQFCPTDRTPKTVRIVPTSANGSTMPEPLTLSGQGLWDVTSAWSGRSDLQSALPSLGGVPVGSSGTTTVYLRASGTIGNLVNTLQLTGDTEHIRISAVRMVSTYLTSQGLCGATIAADGASASACTASYWAGTGSNTHIAVTLTYAPKASGVHSVTISAPSQNLTPTPSTATLSGYTPLSALVP